LIEEATQSKQAVESRKIRGRKMKRTIVCVHFSAPYFSAPYFSAPYFSA
jgi:hypothetical protein